jgi:hypothetical protein
MDTTQALETLKTVLPETVRGFKPGLNYRQVDCGQLHLTLMTSQNTEILKEIGLPESAKSITLSGFEGFYTSGARETAYNIFFEAVKGLYDVALIFPMHNYVPESWTVLNSCGFLYLYKNCKR